jgi:tight adherence protein C
MGLIIAFGVILAAGAVAALAGAVTMPARQRRASIERAVRAGGQDPQELPDTSSARERLFEPLTHKFGQFVLRVSPKGMAETTEKRLVAAGYIGRVSPAAFIGGRVLLGIIGLVFGAIVGNSNGTFAAVLLAAGFGAIFFVFPDRRLQGRVNKRRESIQADLPDALDLLAVSVEAGMTLDASIAILNEHLTGPLADEFALTLGELRIGESRQEALRKLGQRTDVPQMANLTRAIIQSDQLGMALGRIMRIQAQEARIKRQGAIEEKANKLPVKMLFPTVLFIFPALFIVILGPAFIEIFRTI